MNTISFPGLGIDITVNPEAFSIFGIPIYWYGIIIAIGMCLAMVYCLRASKRFDINPDRLLDVVLGGIVGGVIGARLYYVLFSLDYFVQNPGQIFNIKEGGLAIYGGIIGGLLVGILIGRWRKINVKAALDLGGLGLLIGQSIGRWGNFINQEAFGTNTTLPWGMTGDRIQSSLMQSSAALSAQGVPVDPALPVHPCFLYESLWCLLGFILLHIFSKRRKFDGQIFLLYVGWYGLGRFFIEGLRTDSLMIMPGSTIRVSQVIAALAVVACIVIHVIVMRKIKTSAGPQPEYTPVFGDLPGPEGEMTAEIEQDAEVLTQDSEVIIEGKTTEELSESAPLADEEAQNDAVEDLVMEELGENPEENPEKDSE